MKYVALLRGINVGGNNKVSMAELKKTFEKNGFRQVSTYINSGNVIFSSEKPSHTLTDVIEDMLVKAFHFPIRVVVRSFEEFKKAVKDVPDEWTKQHNLRCYIAFVRIPATPSDVAAHMKIKEGIDSIKVGAGEIYMTTRLDGLTKSGFNKLVGTKVYQDITIRNFTTAQKLLALLEK